MKKNFIAIAIVIVLLVTAALIFDWGRSAFENSDFKEDAAARNVFDYSSTTAEMSIAVMSVKENQTVTSPIIVSGKAKGNWYFEASFPVQLIDEDGNIISSTVAKAEGDWMTNDFVNFTAILEYDKSTSTDRALIVLSKDNPSGNPEFDQSIFIPVTLK